MKLVDYLLRMCFVAYHNSTSIIKLSLILLTLWSKLQNISLKNRSMDTK